MDETRKRPRAVRVVVEYDDGRIDQADGDDAGAIWEHILGMYVMEALHGRPYNGPKFRVVREPGEADGPGRMVPIEVVPPPDPEAAFDPASKPYVDF